MGKNWKPEEIALACKAYVDLTRNLIQGADQCLIDFSSDLMEKYKAVWPKNCPEGTYYYRNIT